MVVKGERSNAFDKFLEVLLASLSMDSVSIAENGRVAVYINANQ